MSKSQRTKGASGERELCALLSDAFGEKITRRLGQARDSGHDVDIPGFTIECKRRKRIAGLYEWLAQAGNGDGNAPTLMLRADGRTWLVVMALDDWIPIVREDIAAVINAKTATMRRAA